MAGVLGRHRQNALRVFAPGRNPTTGRSRWRVNSRSMQATVACHGQTHAGSNGGPVVRSADSPPRFPLPLPPLRHLLALAAGFRQADGDRLLAALDLLAAAPAAERAALALAQGAAPSFEALREYLRAIEPLLCSQHTQPARPALDPHSRNPPPTEGKLQSPGRVPPNCAGAKHLAVARNFVPRSRLSWVLPTARGPHRWPS